MDTARGSGGLTKKMIYSLRSEGLIIRGEGGDLSISIMLMINKIII